MNQRNTPFLETKEQVEDVKQLSLRPQTLSEYIGQSSIKQNLEIIIEAAKKRKDVIDHVLLYGPPGLGKTTLAFIIGHEMGHHVHITSGPAIEKVGDLAAILTNMQEGDILFIDEIHRLSRSVEEVLYPAMEDFAIDIVIGKGPSAKTLRLDLPRITIIGATTKLSLLSSPLRDRFGILYHFNFYDIDDIKQIIIRSSGILSIPVDEDSSHEIAKRSRRTPRIANRLLKRVRDFAQVKGDGTINLDIAKQALHLLHIDEQGLDEVDRRILTTIIQNYEGGPVGIKTIAASTSEEVQTIEEVYEPYLLQMGYLDRTNRGRIATKKAFEHLGVPYTQTESLF